jgi:hypothetical protein
LLDLRSWSQISSISNVAVNSYSQRQVGRLHTDTPHANVNGEHKGLVPVMSSIGHREGGLLQSGVFFLFFPFLLARLTFRTYLWCVRIAASPPHNPEVEYVPTTTTFFSALSTAASGRDNLGYHASSELLATAACLQSSLADSLVIAYIQRQSAFACIIYHRPKSAELRTVAESPRARVARTTHGVDCQK